MPSSTDSPAATELASSGPIEFHAGGGTAVAVLRTPRDADGPCPVVVQCPGWTTNVDAPRNMVLHQRLTQAGTAVLAFDYSGRGAAAGSAPTRTVRAQIEQIHGALCLARQLPGVDAARVGLLGSGGTGGGHVLIAAAEDPRVRAVVSQFPIAGGRAWLRALLSATTWRELTVAVENDRRERLSGGRGADIDIDALWRSDRGRAPIPLEFVDSLLSYHPIDVLHRVRAAALVIGVEDDEITPTAHAERVFARLRGPKRLLIQRDVGHHESYEANADIVDGAIAAWYQEHLAVRRTVEIDRPPRRGAHRG